MKKYLRKISAILMAAIMVLSMCVPAFAEAGVKPKEGDKATATVLNVEDNATVTAYKIVNPVYNTNGFIGYTAADGVTVADVTNPTPAEITAIAKSIDATLADGKKVTLTQQVLDKTGTANENGLYSYSKELTVGTWLVLVTGNVKEVYNPMIVSVYYSVGGNNNEMAAGRVDANSDWEVNGETVYAKSTKPFITKTIVNSGSNNQKGDDKAVGDTVQYKIETKVPSYSEEYSTVTLKINDVLSDGLTLKQGEGEITVTGVPSDKYELTGVSDRGFTVTVDSAWALANQGADITVTYSATINENAKYNFNPNTNTATLEYTNKQGVQSVADKTYHYTFGIDAELTGQESTEWTDITKEITKTGEERIIKDEQGNEIGRTRNLPGATFKMTRLDNAVHNEDGTWTVTPYSGSGTTEWTATSGEDGHLKFTGLDAGWYELKETQAPSGYTLEGKKHYVHITATYLPDGRLESYSVVIDGAATSTYTAQYTGTTTTVSKVTIVEQPTTISNTKISNLPSTGGTGTYFFTIVGVMVMAGVAGMFLISRRKENE